MTCPHCNDPLNAHENITNPGDTPQPGDATMCMRCLSPSVFEGHPVLGLRLRPATVDEELELAKDARMAILIDARNEFPDDPKMASLMATLGVQAWEASQR